MRNIWTIARKELRTYFDHPTAYILVVVFLAINFFFYFRSALLVGEASLRPMFDLLPWIFLFFIPAVTMGALAEERRHGTMEIVLTHPVREHEFLLGKYLGDLLFLSIGLGATLVVPLTLLIGGTPDFGVIIAQYVGSLLLAGAMAAIGIFASALTRNQITAFIVGTTAIFILMLLGVEVVQVSLPGWLSGPLGQLAILTHFQNVTRGVLDLRDVVYFVTVAAAFLALGYWLLLRERLNRASGLYRNLQVGTAAIIGIALFANLFGNYIPGRLDLTADHMYTLSKGTKQILRNLKDVVTITLYASNELPSQVKPMERDVRDVLRDFRRYSDGNVQVVIKNPDQSDAARQEAQRVGVRPVQFNVMRREELQLKQGWLGLGIRYADQTESIPFVGQAQNLEYQLASDVWKLTRTETPKVAFVTGHGEGTPSDYSGFRRQLGQSYEVTTVDLSSDSLAAIDPGIKALIMGGPRQALDARTRHLLRTYLFRGGRVLYLGRGVNVNLRFLFANQAPDSVRDLTGDFGVRLNGDLVYDLRSNESISMPGQFVNYVVAYPFWVRALPTDGNAITQGLNSVFLPWPSSLDTIPAAGRKFIPLLTSSPYAGIQANSFQIRPSQKLNYDREDLKGRLLAVAVDGALAVARPKKTGAPAAGQDSGGEAESKDVGKGAGIVAASSDTLAPAGAADTAAAATPGRSGPKAGRVVVVGDADFLTDQFVRNSPENVVFALNALDWLTQTDALMSIRSKTATPRPLVFSSDFQKELVKYINLIGVPLAFVVLGAVRLIERRRLTRRKYGE